MMQWPYMYVASVFDLFQTCVASVLYGCSICFSAYAYLLQASIQNVSSVSDYTCCKCMFINVSPVSDVCCRSASCCSITRHRKRTHTETVSTSVAVPTCMASEAGVDGPHLHVHQQACGARLHAYVHDVQALRHAEAGVQAQQLHAGQAPFHFFHEWSALISRGNRSCRGKIVAILAAAYSRERALLAHWRLREQSVLVGARR
jgi:hypothetical protein